MMCWKVSETSKAPCKMSNMGKEKLRKQRERGEKKREVSGRKRILRKKVEGEKERERMKMR